MPKLADSFTKPNITEKNYFFISTANIRYARHCYQNICTVKLVHAVTSIKQSPVLQGHFFLDLS